MTRHDQGTEASPDPWEGVQASEYLPPHGFHTYYRADLVDRARVAVDAAHRAEIARLTQERDEWKHSERQALTVVSQQLGELHAVRAERDALAAQVAALREEAARYENAQCITCGRHFVDDAATEGGSHE